MALPIALLGLVLVSLLVTAALLTSSTELAISGAQRDATVDLYRTESALQQYLAEQARTDALQETSAPFAYPAANPVTRLTVTRLAVATFDDTPNPGTTTRRETYSVLSAPVRGRALGTMVDADRVWTPFNLNITAAATVASDRVSIGGSTTLAGAQDSKLCSSTEKLNDVTIASDVVEEKIQTKALAQGEAGLERSTMTKAQLAEYVLNGLSPERVARLAQIRFGSYLGAPAWPGSEPSSELARTNKMNWGCPYKMVGCTGDADTAYFPVVAIAPASGTEVHLNGGHGQGILIVLGDLRINGRFDYNGIVVVSGDLTKINGGGTIAGALVAMGDVKLEDTLRDDDDEGADFTGNSLVRYNKCAVDAAEAAMKQQQAQNTPRQYRWTSGWFEVVR